MSWDITRGASATVLRQGLTRPDPANEPKGVGYCPARSGFHGRRLGHQYGTRVKIAGVQQAARCSWCWGQSEHP